MDRGRVGYDLVGNKTIRENALRHKRNCHLERLKKIKNREAGSSKTLDNNTPGSLVNQMISSNPRKKKIKEDNAISIQRENRALLQRISLILTAPPKITDADYQRLKKLATRDKVREKFEKALDEKRNEEIFNRIHKTSAYYHHKQWEEDYARQKAGQKFMRQVTYKRPKGFVDPFAAPLRKEEDEDDLDDLDMDDILKDDEVKPPASSKSHRTPGSRISKGGVSTSKSSGHLNNVRTLRERGNAGQMSAEGSQRSKTSPSKLERSASRKTEAITRQGSNDSHGSNADAMLNKEAEEVNKNKPLLLAHVHRHTPLKDGRLDTDRSLPSTEILTDIQCWRKIVQSDEIYENVAVKQLEEGEDDTDSLGSSAYDQPLQPKEHRKNKRPVPIITIRAEILDFSERDAMILLSAEKLLCNWRAYHGDDNALPIRVMKDIKDPYTGDTSSESTQQDYDQLKVIAREIAAEASLIIENDPKVLFGESNILRIVLPAHFAMAEVYKREPKKGLDMSNDLGMAGPARLLTSRFTSYDSVDEDRRELDIEAAEAETNKKVKLSASCIEVPFHCSEPVMVSSRTPSGATIQQVIAASNKPPKETIPCSVELKELGDEKASISVTILNNFKSVQLRSQKKGSSSKYELSIDANTTYSMPLALPSIMSLDPELVQEFFNNIMENMQLSYDRGTDQIFLCLKE